MLALFASSIYAETPTNQFNLRLIDVVNKAKGLSLAEQDQWLYLNHYRVKPFNRLLKKSLIPQGFGKISQTVLNQG